MQFHYGNRSFEFDEEERREKRGKILKELVIFFLEALVVIGIAYGITHFMLEKTKMVGDSMNATLVNDDSILINKFAYKFSKPKRFDVIVFKQSGKEHSFYNIKRVIGLPGETVLIQDGKVFINGDELKEASIVEAMNNGGLAETELTLDASEYFVLGDNRNFSEDSRFANIGNVVKDDIIGKAWIRLNSFNFVNEINRVR